MIAELIKAFFFIFMAEMGDKTQILAMAFATKYKVKKVLLGVLIGSFLNHGVAVILGTYMGSIIPLELVRFIAACAFVFFGLWTLQPEKDEEEETSREKFGPVVTVALAFFIGELGDKTQLAAITLSTTAQYPVLILMGTVLGMVVTSSVGIFVGSKLGKKIPELAMKMISGFVFVFFGIIGLFETVPQQYITPFNIGTFFIVLAIPIFFLLRPTIRTLKDGGVSAFKKTAEDLQKHMEFMKKTVENICLGEQYCGQCQGKQCLIGFLKEALHSVNAQGIFVYPREWESAVQTVDRSYDMDKVVEGLATSILVLDKFNKSQDERFIANKAREVFEQICFDEHIPFKGSVKDYFSLLLDKNQLLGQKVIEQYRKLDTIE